MLGFDGILLFEHRSKDTVFQSFQKITILLLLTIITIGVVFALTEEIEVGVQLTDQLLHPQGLLWLHFRLAGVLAKQNL